MSSSANEGSPQLTLLIHHSPKTKMSEILRNLVSIEDNLEYALLQINVILPNSSRKLELAEQARQASNLAKFPYRPKLNAPDWEGSWLDYGTRILITIDKLERIEDILENIYNEALPLIVARHSIVLTKKLLEKEKNTICNEKIQKIRTNSRRIHKKHRPHD